MTSISITIPNEYNALTRAAEMLSGLARDLSNKDEKWEFKSTEPLSPLESLQEVIEPLKNWADEDADPIGDIQKIADNAITDLSDKHTQITPSPVTETTPNPPIESSNDPRVGVQLDSAGLPYDVRIHTGGKIRIQKKNGQWKYARNVDPELVKTVEAELRAAMAAGPHTPITETAPPPVTETAQLYVVDGNEFTAEQLRASGWTDQQMVPYKVVNNIAVVSLTFPEFMAKTTAAMNATTISEAMLKSALDKQGLASLPLLAARPDLIPAIHAELFG